MSVVCGIDEAGYGPMLGPYVVTAAVFAHPEAHLPERFRRVCSRVFADSPRRGRTGFVVCDSKVLHSGGNGLARLERHVLPFLGLAGGSPPDAYALLRGICLNADDLLHELRAYPWYADACPALPLIADADAPPLDAAGLAQALADNGLAFCGCRTVVLPVARFNAGLAAGANKSELALARIGALLMRVLEDRPADDVDFVVDRQGGRMRYAQTLQGVFPGQFVTVVQETHDCSAYRLRRDGREVTLRFQVRAESACPATALASMVSKYVRELFMAMFNAYWTARQPGLAPTAGYVQDARRFLRETAALREKLEIPESHLVRRR